MKLPARQPPYTGRPSKKYTPWTLFLAPPLILAALIASTYPGARFSVIAFFCLAGLALLYGGICALCRHSDMGGPARAVRQVFHLLLALWLLSFIVVELLIVSGARGDPDGPADCVLVLGAGLRGEDPSFTLAVRLDAAIEYLRRWPDTPAVVSGGQGAGESVSEAEAMRRYLIQRGIEPARVIREDRSTNTEENVAYSLPLMPEGTRRVAVVSNEFHLYRARALLRRAGAEPLAVWAPTPLWYLKPGYYFREYFSVVFMWLGI